jgi:hypothetical protein
MDGLPILAMRALLERYARLIARLGNELGERPMVLPTSEFFPDAFTKDQRSLARLVRRMQKHAGMSDIPLSVRLVGNPEGALAGACGSGGCGAASCSVPETDEPVPRVVDEGEGWRMNVPEAELEHSVVLTANVARALGYVFLVETRADCEALEEPVDVTADLAAVALGFGVVLLEASYMYSKSCGGPKVARATRLSCPELAVAHSAFMVRGRHPLRRASRELGTTQRAVVEETFPWLEANPALADALRGDPARIARGEYALQEPRPWLLRVFGKGRRSAAASPEQQVDIDELEAMVSALPAAPRATSRTKQAADPRHDELRALVDEVMSQARTDAE